MCNHAGNKGDTLCTITATEDMGHGHHRFTLKPRRPIAPKPGQFVMVRVREGTQPLLRRPLGVHRYNGETGEIEILFRVVGEGTRMLSGMREGDVLDVLAPLGRGFGEPGETALLVGGGIGVAPLLYLAEDLMARGVRTKLLLGGRSDRDLLCHGDFQCLAVPCSFATEDGSMGAPGLVTELLAKELEAAGETGRAATSVHACGPVPMLAAVARLSEGYGVRCEVSLESRMACGVGACLGCIVQSREGENLRVCKEGPVFDSRELAWP